MDQVEQLLTGILTRGVTWVFCEQPDRHLSARGVAAMMSGGIQKLYWQVGYLSGRCAGMGIGMRRVVPMRWKGTVKKTVTRKRLMRLYGCITAGMDHNVVDAIGIGHYFLNKRS
jgi:hypothetical protein